MKLNLPNSAFLGNIDAFIRSFNPAAPEKLEVTCNKKWMSLHPVVLSMTAALGIRARQIKCAVECEPLQATSKNYLARMGLTNLLGLPKQAFAEHEASGRFIPLTQIHNANELHKFITDMVPLLYSTPKTAEPIKYVLSELINNVLEHAQSPVGAVVCAQFFKKSNRISIGVADVGVGVKETIRKAHYAPTDAAAIKLALTPGITGTTKKIGGSATNAGAGLFFIKSIAKVNRQFFMLYSGDTMYKLLKTPAQKPVRLHANPEEDKCSILERLPYWQGTAVGIDISIETHQAFDQLLDLIRNVYRSDVRERTKERFKKARFI
jgi:anti-sigma regulatory factor (Ser/Thr protein kinase)